jgi:hypothetical protein
VDLHGDVVGLSYQNLLMLVGGKEREEREATRAGG